MSSAIWSDPLTDTERDMIERVKKNGTAGEARQWLGHLLVCYDALLELVGPTYHVFDNRGMAGWSLKHPLACRDEMLDCPVHIAAMELDDAPVPIGRYRCDLDGDGGLTFAPLEPNAREGSGE